MVARGAMSEFVFQWSAALALLLGAIPLVLLLAHARSQRLKLIEAMGGGHPTHRKLRDVLRVSAYILLVLALARPGYAPQTEATSRSGRDVVFAIDVSQSMLAEDAIPSRLEVAKQGVRDALKTFGNERVGLIVYAGSSSILCPLTYDYDFVRYMLEQANPRTVDFGGTTLQSAVEKAVDQVFIEGRADVQDLIVITDGGDHGSIITKTAELLEEKGVDTLLLGVGDPHRGSPIKLKDEDGNVQLLEYEGSAVSTKLEDAALREFAQQSPRVDYLPVGTSAFNLGQIYLDYSKDKQVEASDSESGIVVYKEAAIFFLIPALILLLLSERWGARGLQLTNALILVGLLGLVPKADAVEAFRDGFESAALVLQEGKFEEAATLFADLHTNATDNQANREQLAAIQFNRGLALVGQASQQLNPQLALAQLQQAQRAFLSAMRSAPDLQRAGIRIELTAERVYELQRQIAEADDQNSKLNEMMQELLARLQVLLKAQTDLRHEIEKTPNRASASIPKQQTLTKETEDIQQFMQEIDEMMQIDIDGIAPQDTLLSEPLRLIEFAKIAQTTAAEFLAEANNWRNGTEAQLEAEQHIEAILGLLASDSQETESEPQETDDMGEDYDYMDDDMDGMSGSEAMEGDFAASSEMQELPVPNYSAEDILLEEQGNQQFREQKRASANAGKVEKDF